MVAAETELEMVSRHVCQGDRYVSRQIEIIATLRRQNHSTELAESLLLDFQFSLRACRDHLDRLI